MNSVLLNDKKMQKNISSFFTAENSSTIQSNIMNSFIKTKNNRSLNNISNIKFLNSTIFTNHHKTRSKWIKNSYLTSQNTSKDKCPLYLTETKNVLTPSFQSKKKNKNLYRIKNNKRSLPTLKCYSHWENEKYPDIFTCGDFSIKPRFLTKLYNRQNNINNQKKQEKDIKNLNISDENKNNFNKTTIREYINNANKMNYLNYCINLKKEAFEEYKKNIKSQIKSLNYSISQINNYKINLEKNFDIKYNEDKKEFEKEITQGKIHSDFLKKKLFSLLKQVGALSQAIIKKQNIKKRYEKWLSFQILVKDGIKLKNKNIIEYIEKKYGKTPIFENYEDFFSFFKKKEDNNIRLLDKSTKINEEMDKLRKELDNLKSNYFLNNKNNNIDFQDKEEQLNLLKLRNKEMNIVKNNLLNQKKMVISKSLKNINTYYNKEKYKDIDIEKDLKLNPLGVYCYNFDKVKNINKIINCIYISILKNNIKGLIISEDIKYRLNNTLNENHKILLQLQIIEFSLNYLKSSINSRKKYGKYQIIIKDTKELIDLYQKTKKSQLYEEEIKKKNNEFINKMKEKSGKVYFIPKKKFNQYPTGLFFKQKALSVKKIKKTRCELFDFLYEK